MTRSFYWYQDICNLVTFVIFGISCFWEHLCFRNAFCYINHILIFDYGTFCLNFTEKLVLEEDYLGLRDTLVCKICREKDVAAAFLPCGHLVCCLDCAPAMRKCPSCGEVIKGTVKTYFA